LAQSRRHDPKDRIQDRWVFKLNPRSSSNFSRDKLPVDEAFYVAIGTLHEARKFRLNRPINVSNFSFPSRGFNVLHNCDPFQRLFHS
jgi:hypothetical protein